MNRRQQGNLPGQGSFTGYTQGQPAAQNPAGYPYSLQNSGRQQVSAGYFQQNAYPQQGAQQNAYPQPNAFTQQGPGQQNPGNYTAQTGGYGRNPAGYPQQPGYVQPQAQGYYPQAGYPQNNGAGYGRPDASWPQGGAMPANGAGQPAGGYPAGMGTGYPQQLYAGPAGYPQQGGAPENGGSYIPQTPYGNGYAPQGQGYTWPQQGYGAYQQMGRSPTQSTQQLTDSARQIPLNGAGYVPPPVPVRKTPFRLTDTWLIIISVLLLILFAAGMFASGLSVLRWVFLALAAVSIIALWVRPMTAGNKRLCYTLVFGALALVTMVSAITGAGGNTRNGGGGQRTNPPAASSQNTPPASGADLSGGIVIDGQSGQTISSIPAAAITATPAPQDDNSVVERMESFFYYWNANQIDEMLPLCAPSWQSGLESPRTSLFALMANRRPLELTAENITGTNDDDSRTITISVLMDRNNNKNPVKYRMNVIMVKEGGEWYVDPQSLKSNERETETPDASVTATPAPTPQANAATVLYYNPNGGTKYHLDPNCKSTHEKYLPFKGHFTFGELNDDKYASLTPCNVCGAPLRP